MSRQRVIASIGEALIIERAGAQSAGGLAMTYAAAAVKSEHRGVAVSRVGQDEFGDRWLAQAREQTVDIEHVQSDPDLPTARLIERSLAGRMNTSLTANAAFDNLQWDFDLVDLAQRAEIVFFGEFARRGGQTRSVVKQFLNECVISGGALRVFDLTNREGDRPERTSVIDALDTCDVLLADEHALSALSPASEGDLQSAIKDVYRISDVQVIVIAANAGGAGALRATSRDDHEAATASAIDADDRAGAMVRLVVGLLEGRSLRDSVGAMKA